MALTTTQAAAAVERVLHDAGVAGNAQVLDVSRSSNVVTLKLVEPMLEGPSGETPSRSAEPGEIRNHARTFTVTVT
jgi:hypothetical protein